MNTFNISVTRDETNILSKCRSSLAKTSSKLPLAQYAVNIAKFPCSTHAPINGIKFSCLTSRIYNKYIINPISKVIVQKVN